MRAVLAGMLCGLLVGQPVWAEKIAASAPKVLPTQAGQLGGEQRVLHALDRLTFGPRPGDVARVQRMGLQAWFEQQLNPRAMDDSKLEAELAQFPAMQMIEADLVRRYPGPQAIRQIVQKDLPLPNDPELRAIYADQIAFYKMQQAKKEQAKAVDAVEKGQDALMDEGLMVVQKPVAAAQMAPLGMPVDHSDAMYPKEQAGRILGLAPAERMHVLLGMPADQLVRFRQSLDGQEVAALSAGLMPLQKETLLALPGSLQMIRAEELQSRVLRDVYSERQLEAVMTDFWLNHFNVYIKKNQVEPYEIPAYERDTIRPRALGKFEDLLVATAESPAMLTYLDNWRSIGPDSRVGQRAAMQPKSKASEGLNENYGRELMELHTLGVGGGYTQADVTQVAKVFTGWTIAKPYQGGGFTFDERRHEPGSKTVLGVTIRENGQKEGLEVLHMLATSPATARFVSAKLAVRFVSDDPPAALVDKMAKAFLASDGDIKVVLRTMFQAPEFWSKDVYRAKVKTPLEFAVSAVRASGVQVESAQALVQALEKLGMPLYGMQTPNGYSWKKDDWVSTGALVSRMNFALAMSGGRLPGVKTEWGALLGEVVPVGYAPDAKERKLELALLGEPVSARTRATVLGQVAAGVDVIDQAASAFDLKGTGGNYFGGRGAGVGSATEDREAGVMAGLLLGSPEFQRR